MTRIPIGPPSLSMSTMRHLWPGEATRRSATVTSRQRLPGGSPCDSRLEVVLDDPYGLCLGVVRTTRTIPAWLARQIRYRDKTCAYPGCERDFLLEIHHIIHWVDGGPTDYDNLVLL